MSIAAGGDRVEVIKLRRNLWYFLSRRRTSRAVAFSVFVAFALGKNIFKRLQITGCRRLPDRRPLDKTKYYRL